MHTIYPRLDLTTTTRLLREIDAWTAQPLSPQDWNRKFLPRYFTHVAADFHLWLDVHLRGLHLRRGSRTALIAPREAAKSTWVTLAYVLRCAVEGWEPYLLIFSDSDAQACKMLQDLRAELEQSNLLAEQYPAATGSGAGEWRGDAVRLRNGVLIESLGRGAKVRGRRNRAARPSLIVLDDVQSNRDVTSPTERRKAWDWFTREVLPVGTETTNVLSVGTALHREAIAVRAGTLPGWISRTFRAVLAWPTRPELWMEWERLASNMMDEHRGETAAAFYAAHRAEMEKGAETFWPSRKPIAALMAKRAEIGTAAFDSEYQGNPTAPESAEWPAEYFDRPGLWFDDWPTDLRVRVQALDPSKGSDSKSGDKQAHVLVGLHKDGTLYVEGVLVKETVALMVARAVDLAARSGFGKIDSLAVENNDGLGMLVAEFQRELNARKMLLPVEGVLNSINKIVRIRRLGIYLGQSKMRFRNTPGTRLLVEQLREFPNAEHDDGPDALELAIRRLELMFSPR